MLDMVIVGSGSAGLCASIYANRAMLECVVIEKNYTSAGLISEAGNICNYLGFNNINGFDLGEKFREHALDLGAKFITDEVLKIEKNLNCWRVILKNGNPLISKTVIYCAGTSHKKLGVKGDDKSGVSYCAVCDGGFFKEKTVTVIGGGDTGFSNAVYLSALAKKVYLIHRSENFRANQILQKAVRDKSNIHILTNTKVLEIRGKDKVEFIDILRENTKSSLQVDGVFTAIGSVANTKPLEGVCDLDENGYVIAGEDCETSAEGLFVGGDVRKKALRQIITACADGANAQNSAQKYLSRKNLF